MPINATYADADGNGRVNATDVLAIKSNYGKTHTNKFAISNQQNNSDNHNTDMLFTSTIKPDVTYISGDTFRVDIKAQNVENLFGLAFELLYSEGHLVSPISIVYDKFADTGLVHLSHQEYGKICIGVSRKGDQEYIKPSDTVVQINMKGYKTAPKGTLVNFSLHNVVAVDPQGNPINFNVENYNFIVSVESPNENPDDIPASFQLFQNYPNPFNPETHIRFQIPKQTLVTLKIFDVLGHEINTLCNGKKPGGSYQVNWDGRNNEGKKVTSGIYIYRIQAGEFVESKKMILLQ